MLPYIIRDLPIFAQEPTPPPRTGKWESIKPKPIPRKSVNEDGYKPIPKPRTDRPLKMQNARNHQSLRAYYQCACT